MGPLMLIITVIVGVLVTLLAASRVTVRRRVRGGHSTFSLQRRLVNDPGAPKDDVELAVAQIIDSEFDQMEQEYERARHTIIRASRRPRRDRSPSLSS